MSDAILKIDGEVANPTSFSFEDLASFDESVQIIDVSQIEPSRQGDAIRLQGLLDRVNVQANAAFLGLHSAHDDFHASIPLAQVRERAFVIYRLDGKPLPREKGGPARFFILDHASCNTDDIDECANVKFVDHMELTVERGFDNRPQDEEEHARLHEHD